MSIGNGLKIGKEITNWNLPSPISSRSLLSLNMSQLLKIADDLGIRLPHDNSTSMLRKRLLQYLRLEWDSSPKSGQENFEAKDKNLSSPPNWPNCNGFKNMMQCSLDGESSQSASYSKVLDFVKLYNGQISGASGGHATTPRPKGKNLQFGFSANGDSSVCQSGKTSTSINSKAFEKKTNVASNKCQREMSKIQSDCDEAGLKTGSVKASGRSQKQKQKKRDLSTPIWTPEGHHYKRDLYLSEGEKKVWEWCNYTLQEIQKMPEAVLFLEPVDWKKLQLPLYPNIIKNPMDLNTIKEKLDSNQYADIFEFDKDMKLVWSNAKVFNRPGSNIFKSAEYL